jgi:hypothetical protein
MRWIKHLTGAHQDEKMARLVAELGLEGYGFYWLVLETVAGQIEAGSDRTSVSYPIAFWRKTTGFSIKKLRIFVENCADLGIIAADFSENSLTISIPNILKYRDEWSRKKGQNSGVTPEQLRSKDSDTDTETEEDSRTPPTPPLGGGRGEEAAADPAEQIVEADIELEQFFDAYPVRARQTIHACIPAWRAMKKAKAYPGLSKLFDSLCEWEASDQWQRDGGRYIPTPQKFLADRLWLAAPARAAPQQRQPDRGVPKHVQDRNAIARAYLRSEGVDPDACTAELYAAAYGDNRPTGGGAEPQGSRRADGDQGGAGKVRDRIPGGQDGGRGDSRHGENMGRRPRAFSPGDDRGGREAAPEGVEVLADHR